MQRRTFTTLFVAAVLVAATAVPTLAAAGGPSVTLTRDATGAATATVTQNGSAAANATVDVAADGPYAGTGTHTADANGTVTLPAPNATMNLTVVATVGNESDRRGPPTHAGPKTDESDERRGPPATDERRGPPAHAGGHGRN